MFSKVLLGGQQTCTQMQKMSVAVWFHFLTFSWLQSHCCYLTALKHIWTFQR